MDETSRTKQKLNKSEPDAPSQVITSVLSESMPSSVIKVIPTSVIINSKSGDKNISQTVQKNHE